MAKTLVLYYSATNTTKRIAETIADRLGADIHAIQAQQPYTAADLDWNDPQSRTSIEQHQHAQRVPIKDDLPDLSGYDNVIIGHPIWWGIPPRLIAATIDQLDLNGKVLATFGTSSSTGYDRAQSNIARTVKENGYQLDLQQGDVLNSPAKLSAWVNSLRLK